MKNVKHTVSIAGMIGLVALGVSYLYAVPEPKTTVLLTIAGGVAGLGGYQIRERSNGS